MFRSRFSIIFGTAGAALVFALPVCAIASSSASCGVCNVKAYGDSCTYMPETCQARAEIKWVRPICVQDGRYIGWPSVCRLKSGDIIGLFVHKCGSVLVA